MPRDLRNKVILITGASSGIGAATALACAEAGMDVVLNARRADKLRTVADRVERLGRGTSLVVGDVIEDGMSTRLLDDAEAAFGRVDVVFSNAGYGMDRHVVDSTDEEFRQMFDVNFFASVDLLRHAAQRLLAQKRPGHLLMCSSCVSKFSLPRHAAYASSKAAQDAVCSAMRLELRANSIHVSSVHPITTTTEFFDVTAEKSGRAPPKSVTPEHAPKFFTQTPERVARAIVRCLRRPCPEVWTSTIVRGVAAVDTMFPRFGDWVIGRQATKDGGGSGAGETRGSP